MKRDLITLQNLTQEEISRIFHLSAQLKKGELNTFPLKGKTVGLLFQKPSNRTRVSFEVGIWQLGGHCLYLGPDEINLGVRESVADVSKTLSRYLDALVARTHNHQDMVELAEKATIPIINGLSDEFHPCQALTDLFSIQERFGKFSGIKLAYIGDGNNVCHSLLLGSALMGLNMHVATPWQYEPKHDVVALAQSYAKKSGAKIVIDHDPRVCIQKANVVYADVWISMGQENEASQRIKDFQGFQINAKLTQYADPNYIFMHCLPAHRGEEITDEIIDGEHSIVFDQVENRLHVQKAVLIDLLT